MTKEIRINDSEYAQILQQAVSEIQTARTTVARQVNTTVNSVYWNIGKLLFDRNLESGYGSGVVTLFYWKISLFCAINHALSYRFYVEC